MSSFIEYFFRQGLASGQPPGENGAPGGVATSGAVGIGQSAIMAQQNRTLRDPLIGGIGANPSNYPQYSQQRDVSISLDLYNNYMFFNICTCLPAVQDFSLSFLKLLI